jgi:hypothetical protein
MQLPAALQPWREQLAWFDEKIIEAIGPLVVALDPLVALPGPRLGAGALEPDGVDGLARRGSYERLLATEWAIADAVPDEFLRRAAGGEHLFLAPRLRAPRVERELVALFDAGPDQLGEPRLAHIALWILLARRAEVAGARFRWGVLQLPGKLGDASSPAMLRQLLEARTFERCCDAHRQAWREHLAASVGERWSIGARTDVDATHGATIRLRFDGTLDVLVATRERQRRATLMPPAPDIAARLLQGRFAPPEAGATPVRGRWRFALQPPPRFSWRGNHVAVPLVGADALCVLHATSNMRKRQAAQNVNLARTQLVAATLSDSRYGGIEALGDMLGLWNGGRSLRVPRPADDAFRVESGQADRLWCERIGGDIVNWLVLDAERRLVRWRVGKTGAAQFDTIAVDVIGVVRAGQERIVYVTFVDRCLELYYWSPSGHRRHVARLVRVSDGTWPLRCVLAGERQRSAWRGAAAIELRHGAAGDDPSRDWLFTSVDTESDAIALRRIQTGSHWKVIGPVRCDAAHAIGGYGLLAIDTTKRRLVVAGVNERTELATGSGDIATASVNDDGTRIAFVDAQRQLMVLRHDGTMLMRTSPR